MGGQSHPHMKIDFRFVLSVPLLAFGIAQAGTLDPFNTAGRLQEPAGCNSPVGQRALDLPAVVQAALCNNPQTREVWANARYQAAQLGVAQAAYLPGVTATLAASRSEVSSAGVNSDTRQRSATLGLNWLLYDFGGREAGVASARALLQAANATQNSTVQQVWLAAVQAFYQVQAAEAALTAAALSEEAASRSYAAAEARYKAGVATPADSLQAKTAWSQAMLARITAAGQLATARGTLASVLGLDANSPLSVTPIAETPLPQRFDADVASLIEQARKQRPDLQAVAAQAQAARENVTVAKAAGRPSISLNASSNAVDADGSPFSRGNTVGVSLTIPLFSGFATNYRIRAAEAQVDSKTAQLERLRLQVAQDVWNAWQNLTTATQSRRATDDLFASAEQAENVALGRYKAGVGTILDVLNAQSALAGARQQKVQAYYNWNVSRAALAQAMGQADLLNLSEVKSQP